MIALHTPPRQPTIPIPTRMRQPPDSPARTTRLRRVLGKLITHGKELAQVLSRPQRPGAMAVLWISVRFGTKDIALMLARITRALRLAAALQAALPKEPPPPARPARAAQADRKPRARPAPRPRNSEDSVLATLPTSKEIAALLRDHPIGEVLTEICLGLGILTVEAFWQELEIVLLENGADRDRIAQDAKRRMDRCNRDSPAGVGGGVPAKPAVTAGSLPRRGGFRHRPSGIDRTNHPAVIHRAAPTGHRAAAPPS